MQQQPGLSASGTRPLICILAAHVHLSLPIVDVPFCLTPRNNLCIALTSASLPPMSTFPAPLQIDYPTCKQAMPQFHLCVLAANVHLPMPNSGCIPSTTQKAVALTSASLPPMSTASSRTRPTASCAAWRKLRMMPCTTGRQKC